MSRADVWMPWYVGEYLADTMHLDNAQHGAYMLLLMHYWCNGPLPNNQASLATIARAERKSWDRKVWPIVREFFTIEDDGKLHQKRSDIERAKASDISDKRRAAAHAKWVKDDGGGGKQPPSNSDANASANASPVHMQTADKPAAATCTRVMTRGTEPIPRPREEDKSSVTECARERATEHPLGEDEATEAAAIGTAIDRKIRSVSKAITAVNGSSRPEAKAAAAFVEAGRRPRPSRPSKPLNPEQLAALRAQGRAS